LGQITALRSGVRHHSIRVGAIYVYAFLSPSCIYARVLSRICVFLVSAMCS